ncbi:MAG: 4Fe-4S binding protein [Fidelibacterota bacterium]|nr:MAG: 4Fe-4S binding protein [Candidatus Neomarinimicrobiota bacterium]
MIQIQKKRCTQCGLCVKDCISGVFRMEEDVPVVRHPELCNRCSHCVSVCPNFAMQGYSFEPRRFDMYQLKAEGSEVMLEKCEEFHICQRHQIYNIADFCNECGNCTTFCPTSGSPFKHKPRLYLNETGFQEATNGYFVDGNTIRGRINGEEETLIIKGDRVHYDTAEVSVEADLTSLIPVKASFKTADSEWIKMTHAIEMYVLLNAVKGDGLFKS